MRFIFTLVVGLIFGLFCLSVGLCVGMMFAPQLKTTEPGQRVMAAAAKLPWLQSVGKSDNDLPWELYNYPTIKFKAKPLVDAPGGIVQLWTTYDRSDKSMKYKLTLFKAGGKQQCEVQMLDGMGFKLGQFNAGDFHAIPGAPDIVEARESWPCQEDIYRQVREYSVK